MILNCIKKNTDFIPMVKVPYFWQASKSLKFGDDIEVDDMLGHQILATFPGCFEVRSFGDTAKKAEPKRGRPKLEVDTKIIDKMENKVEADTVHNAESFC